MKPIKHQPNCKWCKEQGVSRRATWRADGLTDQKACDEHKHLIREQSDDGYMSEGEHQAMSMYEI